jgi:hypothetical protein
MSVSAGVSLFENRSVLFRIFRHPNPNSCVVAKFRPTSRQCGPGKFSRRHNHKMPIDCVCVWCLPFGCFPWFPGAEHCWCLCDGHHLIPCLPCLACAATPSNYYMPTDFDTEAKQEETYLELEETSTAGGEETLRLGAARTMEEPCNRTKKID